LLCNLVKQFSSVILSVMLVTGVGGLLANGTMASFFDTEVSTENEMCAGTRTLELSGGPIIVKCGMPSKWYSEDFMLINAGTLEGLATVHIPEDDSYYEQAEGLKCVEAGALHDQIWDGLAYVPGDPVGAGVATSEPELVAEEGGYVGQAFVAGLGIDAGDDYGPPDWVMSKHTDIKIWFDKNGDGDFLDDGELIVDDKLFNVACTQYDLGVIPPSSSIIYGKNSGGGWGSYFTYHIDDHTLELPLMAGQNYGVGTVTVWNDDANLYVEYDIPDNGWEMTETHLYVGKDPPPKLAPGKFPYQHDPLPNVTTDQYTIPLAGIGAVPFTDVYIAAHAVVRNYSGFRGEEETAWAKGESRKVRVELHLQQVEDPAWATGGVDYDQDGDIDADDAQKRWWPTNAFHGDKCTFDMLFEFKQDCRYPRGY